MKPNNPSEIIPILKLARAIEIAIGDFLELDEWSDWDMDHYSFDEKNPELIIVFLYHRNDLNRKKIKKVPVSDLFYFMQSYDFKFE